MLCGLIDPAQEAIKIASDAGVPWYSSIADMLTQNRPDGLVLATPNQLHLSQGLQCIEAGLPILLEKPITTTVAEGEQLLAAVRKANAKVLIGHHRAHSPIMAKAKEVVASGQLGHLVAITGSATFFKPDHYFVDGAWRKEIGGGPILLNMIHEVHNLRMLCGDIVAVQAFASHAKRGFAVEDTVAINLRFANGALGTFMLSDTAASARSWEQTSQENRAYPSYGDEDRSWWKPFDSRTADVLRDDPIKLQMEHFGAVVRGEAQPLVSAADGLMNLRITEAIAQAAKSGQVVNIASA